ncbi:hypothetical protein EG329_004007 [Mollisiaceae sp. DMI_Dod_QoI]|nr:hypothetical protein EG329_004007 [Helotiales sp. DMI_Dod_QoI]
MFADLFDLVGDAKPWFTVSSMPVFVPIFRVAFLAFAGEDTQHGVYHPTKKRPEIAFEFGNFIVIVDYLKNNNGCNKSLWVWQCFAELTSHPRDPCLHINDHTCYAAVQVKSSQALD